MAVSEPFKVFDAVAVSGTDSYTSKVSRTPNSGNFAYIITKTGNAAGTAKWQVNSLEEATYNAAVSAASGSTQEEKEAANTTGWADADLSPTATITVTGGTDPHNIPVLLTGVSFHRSRLVYTNASGTGTLTARFTALLG